MPNTELIKCPYCKRIIEVFEEAVKDECFIQCYFCGQIFENPLYEGKKVNKK